MIFKYTTFIGYNILQWKPGINLHNTAQTKSNGNKNCVFVSLNNMLNKM